MPAASRWSRPCAAWRREWPDGLHHRILGEEHEKRARRALREMAEDTGGVAFFPKNLDEVEAITQQIAHDIRNQYTILYKPTCPRVRRISHGESGSQAKGYKKLQVRTRSGYYAGQHSAEATPPAGK